MPNTITDEYGMVTEGRVEHGRFIFRSKVQPAAGFNLYVFSPQGAYLGEITQDDAGFRANEGNKILRVNLGSKIIKFEGTLHTKDGHDRHYAAEIDVEVVDPYAFAICYQQGNDPVGQAQRYINADLVRWAKYLDHDDIQETNLRHRAEIALNAHRSEIGLRVREALNVIADPSETYTKLWQIKQQEKVDQAKTGVEQRATAQKSDFEREETAKQNEFQQRQAILEAQTNIFIKQQQQANEILWEETLRRYQKLKDDGYSDAIIEQEEPGLLDKIKQYQVPPQGQLPFAGALPDASGAKQAALLPAADSEPRYNAQLGVDLKTVELSDPQKQALAGWNREYQQAFQIERCDKLGPAENANIQPGDIIVQAYQQPFDSYGMLERKLASTVRGVQVSILILRNDKVYEPQVSPTV